MRRGVIAVLGDAGDFAGVNMIAGTIVVSGILVVMRGWHETGSIIALGGVEKYSDFYTLAPISQHIYAFILIT